ncbi:MAG: hypothetical protein ACTSU5_18185 [Promethearchaeota archaeon]
MVNIPIITSEDTRELAGQEMVLVKMIKSVIGQEKKMFGLVSSWGDLLNKILMSKEKILRKKRDISKQMEILAREDKSEITRQDVDAFKNDINTEADLIEKKRVFAGALKDLAANSNSLIAKRGEYADAIQSLAKQRIKVISIFNKLEKAKNTMQVAEKLQGIEDSLKDAERDFERVKRDLEKKRESLRQEIDEINKNWLALKDSITEFQS